MLMMIHTVEGFKLRKEIKFFHLHQKSHYMHCHVDSTHLRSFTEHLGQFETTSDKIACHETFSYEFCLYIMLFISQRSFKVLGSCNFVDKSTVLTHWISFRPIISSASTERIIHWSMPDGEKIKEITPSDISINCISVNPQGALVAAGMLLQYARFISKDIPDFICFS